MCFFYLDQEVGIYEKYGFVPFCTSMAVYCNTCMIHHPSCTDVFQNFYTPHMIVLWLAEYQTRVSRGSLTPQHGGNDKYHVIFFYVSEKPV